MSFSSIVDAISELKKGKTIIVVDDENRENEGDLLTLAQLATPATVNFMATFGRGLICMPITRKRAEELELPMMVEKSTDKRGTAFTVSVDYKTSTTGISAFERAETILEIINEKAVAEDFNRPGHIFPLIAKDGGVLKRPGHTEAAVDLARLCDTYPAGVICEIMKDDGTMARLPDLIDFSKKHKLILITIADLIKYLNEQ